MPTVGRSATAFCVLSVVHPSHDECEHRLDRSSDLHLPVVRETACLLGTAWSVLTIYLVLSPVFWLSSGHAEPPFLSRTKHVTVRWVRGAQRSKALLSLQRTRQLCGIHDIGACMSLIDNSVQAHSMDSVAKPSKICHGLDPAPGLGHNILAQSKAVEFEQVEPTRGRRTDHSRQVDAEQRRIANG